MKHLKYQLYNKHISTIFNKNKFLVLSFKKYIVDSNFISKQLFCKDTNLFSINNYNQLKFPLYLNAFESSKSFSTTINLKKELHYILFIKYNYLKLIDNIQYIKILNSLLILQNFRFLTIPLNILF